MTIRLTGPSDGMTIRIEGRLTGADVPVLRGACNPANDAVYLDLSELRWADADGIRALLSLSESGAELHGANSYVRELLREEGK
jgi:ABC-type transporter Mla MlaB component